MVDETFAAAAGLQTLVGQADGSEVARGSDHIRSNHAEIEIEILTLVSRFSGPFRGHGQSSIDRDASVLI